VVFLKETTRCDKKESPVKKENREGREIFIPLGESSAG
jgi:hypothetical protein